MALTSIEMNWKDGSVRRLQFYTEQHETGLYVAVQICNENWKPVGEAAETTDTREESVYHKELRETATEKGEFVAQYSTNPEWNPGYVSETKNEDAV